MGESTWVEFSADVKRGENRKRSDTQRTVYSLTKTETLYIATKFNDKARTR